MATKTELEAEIKRLKTIASELRRDLKAASLVSDNGLTTQIELLKREIEALKSKPAPKATPTVVLDKDYVVVGGEEYTILRNDDGRDALDALKKRWIGEGDIVITLGSKV